jgi:DNA sulfur modification protein DndD
MVLKRLGELGRIGCTSVADILADLENAEVTIRRLDSQIASLSGIEDQVKKLTDELEDLNHRERDLSIQIHDQRRTEDSTSGLLGPKRAQLATQAQNYRAAAPTLTLAALADRVADVIGEVVSDLYPLRIREVAEEMGDLYRALAHKTLIKTIDIEDNCTVKLLGDRGFDVRSLDTSAGENQIFALSLIGAIAKSADARVPVVMDTPLARLDTEHRLNVLTKFAAQASAQVILLSQPDEVYGPYLRAIRDRISTTYLLEFEEVGNGVGITRVRKGYFEEV